MDKEVVVVPCAGIVNCIECSPFDFCDSLICYSSHTHSDVGETSHLVTIAKFYPEREGKQMFEILKEFPQDRLTTCLSWSPKTFTESLPYEVVLCVGSTDGKVSLISTDLKDENQIQVMGSHSKSVNAMSFDYETGDILASVGDDYKCLLWNAQHGTKHCDFPLKSAGTDVKFNQHDGTKLAVAEKCGVIRFYDLVSMTVFMSVECGSGLILKSIDWSVHDVTRIDALASSDWLTFDTSKSCVPVSSLSLAQSDDIIQRGTLLKVSPLNPQLVAVSCGKRNDVRIFNNSSSKKELFHLSSPLGSGFTWHLTQPMLICGGDKKLSVVMCDNIS